jgi:hypothetical protein
MHQYSKEHNEVKEAVRALDESISTKASKADYFNVRNQLELKMSFEDGEKFDVVQTDKIDKFKDDMESLD